MPEELALWHGAIQRPLRAQRAQWFTHYGFSIATPPRASGPRPGGQAAGEVTLLAYSDTIRQRLLIQANLQFGNWYVCARSNGDNAVMRDAGNNGSLRHCAPYSRRSFEQVGLTDVADQDTSPLAGAMKSFAPVTGVSNEMTPGSGVSPGV